MAAKSKKYNWQVNFVFIIIDREAKGDNTFGHVRPSVRLSVCLFVRLSVCLFAEWSMMVLGLPSAAKSPMKSKSDTLTE